MSTNPPLDAATERVFRTVFETISKLCTRLDPEDATLNAMLMDLDRFVGELHLQMTSMVERLGRMDDKLAELNRAHAALCRRIDQLQ